MAMEGKTGVRKFSTPLIAAIIVIIVLIAGLGYTVALLVAPRAPVVTYTIGLGIAITGQSYATEGPIRRDAAILAINQMNAELTTANAGIRFNYVHEDTKGTTEGALAGFQALATAGVKVVVGPLSSAETSSIRTFVTDNHIVSISPSSTSASLAIADDYVFRAVPTDIPQAKALAQLVDAQGYTKVSIIARNDDYGKGFSDLFQSRFETVYGGQTNKVLYTPGQPDYAIEVNTLSTNVQALGVGPTTAVLVVAFDVDGLNIFTHAMNDARLPNVRWFASESLKRSSFLADTTIRDFLVQVQLSGFFASPERNPVTAKFEQDYVAAYPGRNPAASPYSYYSFDSAMLAMLAVMAAGTYDGPAIKAMLPIVADKYIGASGYKGMDQYGDVAGADYRAWKVVLDAGTYKFTEFALWRFSTEELTFLP